MLDRHCIPLHMMCVLTVCSLTVCVLYQGYRTMLMTYAEYSKESPVIFRERVSALEETAFNTPADTKGTPHHTHPIEREGSACLC